MITTCGTLTAFISSITTPWFLPIVSFGILLLILGAYIITSYFNKSIGLTSEISFLIAFLIGVIVFYGYERIAIAFSISMVVILTLRNSLHKFARKIQEQELMGTLKFAIISFVVLPFLPNRAFDPLRILNPFQIWLMVVFVSGISFFGYVLTKIVGPEKGIGLTGILGGLISSTAVTSSMSERSKKTKINKPLVFATMIASSIMFIRVLFEVFVVNKSLLPELFPPIITMFLVGIIGSFVVWHKRTKVKAEVKFKTPFRLSPALKFGLFFVLILFFSKLAQNYFGSIGLYITSLISGLADVDAITLSMATMAGTSISEELAVRGIMLALFSNTIVKFWISYMFGDKEFWKKVGLISGIMLVSGFIVMMVF